MFGDVHACSFVCILIVHHDDFRVLALVVIHAHALIRRISVMLLHSSSLLTLMTEC